jgi:Holliday junction resolvase RusA-like endonuclease
VSRRPTARRRPAPLTWADARCQATPDGWHFVLPVPERTNAIWRQHRGRTLVSRKHRADKATAPARFGCEPLEGDVAVRLVWVRARKAGDVDSRIKATLDLLNGVAWHDDAQITALTVLRVDADDQPARVEVFVWPADTLPITPT